MLGLDLLDVAIGVIFVFLLVSLIASALVEIIESKSKNRAKDLRDGIAELLGDDKDAQKSPVAAIYNHALVNGLYKGNDYEKARKAGDLPSYIPSRNFALALMDLAFGHATGATPPVVPTGNASSLDAVAVDALRKKIESKEFTVDERLARTLVALADAAQNNAEQTRQNIEDWFNAAMDRVSGWYKRRAQWALFWTGLTIAVLLNIDSIRITEQLSTNQSLRDTVVKEADAYVKAATSTSSRSGETQPGVQTPAQPPVQTPAPSNPASSASGTLSPPPATGSVGNQPARPPVPPPAASNTATSGGGTSSQTPDPKEQLKDAKKELMKLGLDIGWKDSPKATIEDERWCASSCLVWCWIMKFFGLLITALAVSLGAPFWFDMLNKIIVVRSTVKPDEKSGTEAPKEPTK